MTSLQRQSDGVIHHLASRTLVGREPGCALVIDHHRVSRAHAMLTWRESEWTVRDLGSRNGTRLDGAELPPFGEVGLQEGQVLVFGDQEAGRWVVDGRGPPTLFATRLQDGHQESGVGDLLCLPERERPEATVWRRPEGGWHIAHGERAEVVHDGEIVLVDGAWRLHLPGLPVTSAGAGAQVRTLQSTRLRFITSRDLEHVRVEVLAGDGVTDLMERQHWFVLWVLAQARCRDAAAADHDQGWLDMGRLARETGIEQRSLDTYISRARRDLADAGLGQAGEIVQSRPGQRRIGLPPARMLFEEGSFEAG